MNNILLDILFCFEELATQNFGISFPHVLMYAPVLDPYFTFQFFQSFEYTHVLIWALSDSENLSDHTRKIIDTAKDKKSLLILSISLWDMALLSGLLVCHSCLRRNDIDDMVMLYRLQVKVN